MHIHSVYSRDELVRYPLCPVFPLLSKLLLHQRLLLRHPRRNREIKGHLEHPYADHGDRQKPPARELVPHIACKEDFTHKAATRAEEHDVRARHCGKYTSVAWMADNGVWECSDEPVPALHGEFVGELLAHCAEGSDPEEGAADCQRGANEEGGRDVERRGRVRGAGEEVQDALGEWDGGEFRGKDYGYLDERRGPDS